MYLHNGCVQAEWSGLKKVLLIALVKTIRVILNPG